MRNILLQKIILDGKLSDMLISDGIIKKISIPDTLCCCGADVEVMDCAGKTALPGFVNMHTHAAMTLMRGAGEDVAFHEWLDRIWKIEAGIDDEFVYHGTKVACLEMIKTGTTTFNDHYWHMPMARKAALEMGLRPVLSNVVISGYTQEEMERQKAICVQAYEESLKWPEKSEFIVGMHAIYSVSEDLLLWAVGFARKRGLRMHLHLSETEKEISDCKALHGGMSPVEYLDSLGVLCPDVIAAHTLWLSENDIEILGKRGVTCVHNVNSNMKLSSGYRFLYNELKAAGANVCLGTDGCASSNDLDMLETMKTSAMLQKAWRNDPTAMPLEDVLSMATENAGKALGLNIGKLQEGALADIIIIDTDNYSFLSSGSFLANLIYSAHSDCVDSVICKGRFVMKNRVVPGERQILEDARRILKKQES